MSKKKFRLNSAPKLRALRRINRAKQARENFERQKIQETALASGNSKEQIEKELEVVKKLRAKFNKLKEGLIETVCETIKNALNTNKTSCSTSTTSFPCKDQNTKEFVCSVCNKKFGTSLGLAIHQKQHATYSREMQCHVCNQLFDNYTVMLTHYFDIHSFQADSEILSEELVFNEEEERSLHELEYLDSRTCEGCLKPFQANLKNYGVHVITKHRDNQELIKYFSFSCSHCNTPYPTRGDLESHWNAKCKTKWKQVKVDSFFGIVCEKCGLKFTNIENLNFHTEIVHGQIKDLPLPKQTYLRKPTGLERERPFVCTFCNKKLISEDGVRLHQLRRHKKIICSVCGETLESEDVNKHRRLHYKSYAIVNICDICGKSLKSYVSLYIHKRYIHGGKMYLCDICGLNCNNPYSLKSHALLHGDWKGFGCSLCEARFKTASDFYTHRRKHRNEIATILKFPKVSPEENSVSSNNMEASKPDLSVTNSFDDLQGKIIDSHVTKQPESLSICPLPLLEDCPNTISSVGPSDSPEHDYLEDIDFDNDDYHVMPEYDNTQPLADGGSSNNNLSSSQPPFPNTSLPNSEKNNTASTTIPKENLEFSQATVTVQSDGSKNRHQQENCNEKMYTKNHDISSIQNTNGQPCLSNLVNSESLDIVAKVIDQNDSLFQSSKSVISIVTNCESEFCPNDILLKSSQSLATQSKAEIGQTESPCQYSKSPVSIPTRSKPELDHKSSSFHSNKSPVSNMTPNESEINNEIFIKTEHIDEDIVMNRKYFPLDPFSPQLIIKLTKLKRFRCIPCGKIIFYSSNSEIRTHRLTHRRNTLKIEKNSNEGDSDYESSENYKRKKRRISRHKSAATKIKRVRIRKTVKVVHRCSQCDAQFSSGKEVSKHCLKEHPEIKCFKCEICTKLYSTQRLVVDHKAKVHFKIQGTVLCELCGKAFKSAEGCRIHFKNMHQPRERKFVCDICGKMFLLAKHLREHKIRHTDNRAFICEQCGKGYYSSKEVKYHVETVHDNLTKHKEAKRQQWLKRKMTRKVTGEKEREFPCILCPATFVTEKSLKNHLELHDPNRKYACDICGLRYKFYTNVITHKSYVHKKNIEIDVAEKPACVTNI